MHVPLHGQEPGNWTPRSNRQPQTIFAGERFMQMFEDADEHAARQASRAAIKDDDGSSSDESSHEDGGSSSDASESSEEEGMAAEEFVFDSRAVLPRWQQGQQQQQQRRPGGPRAKQKGPTGKQLGGAAAAAPALDAKLERKAFMSSKAAKVHDKGSASAPSARSAAGAGAEADEGLTREEFLKMQREVELYGERVGSGRAGAVRRGPKAGLAGLFGWWWGVRERGLSLPRLVRLGAACWPCMRVHGRRPLGFPRRLPACPGLPGLASSAAAATHPQCTAREARGTPHSICGGALAGRPPDSVFDRPPSRPRPFP
jgi:hypothetical protein